MEYTNTPLASAPPEPLAPEPNALTPSPSPPNGATTLVSPTPTAPTPTPDPPQTYLTLLLLSGSRKTFAFPPETTVGRVKELVWGSWPVEWRDEPLPPSPSYFRLLHLGRMLQDDSTLLSNNLPPSPSPQIVHLSIKAFVPAQPEQAKRRGHGSSSSAAHAGAEGEDTGCCGGCVVM